MEKTELPGKPALDKAVTEYSSFEDIFKLWVQKFLFSGRCFSKHGLNFLSRCNTYKLGFGAFMSSIQSHHSKLWFAGQSQNCKLADFEIHEIMESIEAVQKYEIERKEIKSIAIINPALNSVNIAIQLKDIVLFKSNYSLLTNTFNNCHPANDFEFNVVKIPETQSFSNQEFKTNEAK